MIDSHATWLHKIQPVKSISRQAKLLLLLASTYILSACSLTELSGEEQKAFERYLQQSYFDLAPALGAYYALATTEFQVLDDPRLTQALRQSGAMVCTNPPCSVEAVELQSFYCVNDDPDFILLEISSSKITLQRLYQRTNPHSAYTLAGPISVYSMYDNVQMLPNSHLQRYQPQTQSRLAYQKPLSPKLAPQFDAQQFAALPLGTTQNTADQTDSQLDKAYIQSILTKQSEVQAQLAKSHGAVLLASPDTTAPATASAPKTSAPAPAPSVKAALPHAPSSQATCTQGKNCQNQVAAQPVSEEDFSHTVVVEILEYKPEKTARPTALIPPAVSNTAVAGAGSAEKTQQAKQKITTETEILQDAGQLSVLATNNQQDSTDLLTDLHQRINSYREESLMQQNLRTQKTATVHPKLEKHTVETKANNQFPRIFEHMSQPQHATEQQVQPPLLLRMPAPS